ncbi:hypothetical protein [Embleya sp. NBC_00896]|uniref:hypothetical protein n=1 Tax=Embleya sp. NBC_00896 TaxID=2975961 RepID=UPI002F9115A2|nr:hypothetical protein OG928_35390 [Embleya sp. NBC_00896]
MTPDDEYLLRLGRVTYSLTRLDTAVRDALAQLPGLPPALAVRKLAPKTTEATAHALTNPANTAKVADPATRAWLHAAGEELAAAARLRHAITAARSAADDEEPRLHRRAGEHGDGVDITTAWLERAQADLDDALRQVLRPRPAAA